MKSLQVASLYPHKDKLAVLERECYTDLQVLRSGAGHYVGTMYRSPDGFQEPGTRDTVYYGTQEEAKLALEQLEAGIFNMDLYRWHP